MGVKVLNAMETIICHPKKDQKMRPINTKKGAMILIHRQMMRFDAARTRPVRRATRSAPSTMRFRSMMTRAATNAKARNDEINAPATLCSSDSSHPVTKIE